MRYPMLVPALLAAVCALPTFAAAQDYPNRPIKAITTTSAGGLSDLFMRALGDELHKRLGQPLIVENRPGGAMNVGTRACTEAAPDGYTICITNADAMVYNQFLFKKLPFDPETQLQPITNAFHLIHMLVVNSDLKVKNINELVALSKAKPGTHELSRRPVRRWCSTWRRSRRSRAPTGCACRSAAAAKPSTRS